LIASSKSFCAKSIKEPAGHTDFRQRRGLLDGPVPKVHVAPIEHRGRKLAAGLDVVAADPSQRSPQHTRREVAAAGRHRPGGERRADQSDRGAGIRAGNKVGEVGPARHALTVATRLA